MFSFVIFINPHPLFSDMNTAVLFSGGKDSTLALAYAKKHSDVKCLIIIISENPESYMFHTPNIRWAEMQAEAIGLPSIIQKTTGKKELELKDLEKAIKKAIRHYKIGGVVTGAIESVYQASRVQKITNNLDIECFNPLWQKDQIELLNELLDMKFVVIISGIAAEGFDKSWLGRKLDKKMISELKELNKKYGINPAFEGGEAESFVLYAPFFKKRLTVQKASKKMTGENSGYYEIEEMN
jgi:ABC transporter with metal-binding/Fe-S-binding domain ATP-binding protein